MKKTHDYVHYYRGYWSEGGRCRIRIYRKDGQMPVVVCSQLPDNTHTSGTNMAEFLAAVVRDWEAEASKAQELGLRVVLTRTGVVLSESGGALEKMLPFFKLGVGGPVAGGRQYVPWIHADDVVGAILFCLDRPDASGPVNLTAPQPVTNKELSKALGRVLGRPAVAPVPGLAVKTLYGEMASIVTTGARVVPRRLEELGYDFRRPALEPALRAATGGKG